MPHHDHLRPGDPHVERTIDGTRTSIRQLNLPETPARAGFLQRLRRNAALFLAGMYTGESCAGTPHSERRSRVGPRDE